MASSPRSISSQIYDEIETHDTFSDNFKQAAGVAFDFIKNKYNKTSVTAGDALLELFNYQKTDNDDTHLTALFCLSLLMMKNKKNNFDEEHYNLIIRKIVEDFENKLTD